MLGVRQHIVQLATLYKADATNGYSSKRFLNNSFDYPEHLNHVETDNGFGSGNHAHGDIRYIPVDLTSFDPVSMHLQFSI